MEDCETSNLSTLCQRLNTNTPLKSQYRHDQQDMESEWLL